MLCACIDIGSNTTRVLVADVREGRLAEVLQRRAFTRIGTDLKATGGTLSAAKIAEVAEVVAQYRFVAERHGCTVVRTVATAAVRATGNRDELLEALRSRAGVEVAVLDGIDEARLAFVGATRTFGHPLEGVVGVVDVGGGSTEIAVGTMAAGVSWSHSLPVGSGMLSDAFARSDPPSRSELEAMSAHAAELLEAVATPPVGTAVAVGGSATSLRRLMGSSLDGKGMRHAVRELCSAPAEELAGRLELAPERVRLLPAGILVLDAVCRHLRCPLELGCGGVREGVCLELAAADGAGEAL